MNTPGKIGWPIVGDKSIEFYRDPLQFINKHVTHNNSQIFRTRFLNKPTIFVCSNQGVRDVLSATGENLDFGYEAFLKGLFGHNILFSKGGEAQDMRQFLSKLFTSHCLEEYESIITSIVVRHTEALTSTSTSEPVCLYKFFKRVFNDICLSLFLGLDSSEKEQTDSITSLTTDHWRGIVAVPVDFGHVVPSSAYSKALRAKSRLLDRINNHKRQAKSGFPQKMQETSSFEDDVVINNHILLFTCALLPKVFASICTSLCLEIGNGEGLHFQERVRCEETWLEYLLLETMRLKPPLLGGRRLVTKSCIVAGYFVPVDYAVVYMTHPAHRDPSVFENPDDFNPKRWSERPDLKDNLYSYGFGSRCCIGERLSSMILRITLKTLFDKFTVQLCPDQDLSHKFLPVLRPKNSLMVHVSLV